MFCFYVINITGGTPNRYFQVGVVKRDSYPTPCAKYFQKIKKIYYIYKMKNWLLLREHILTIPPERFDMGFIKDIGGKNGSHTIGHPLAHSVYLDFGLEMVDAEGNLIYMNRNGDWPKLTKWCLDGLGIEMFSPEYEEVMGQKWKDIDNTIEGFIKRLDNYINKKRTF